MLKTIFRSALLATLVLAAAACNNDSSQSAGAKASGPEQTVQRSIALARDSDVAGLIQNSLPPEEFARIKAEWASEKDEAPVDDAARARFAETMAKLTADDAAATLYKELEPDIRQFDAQYQKQMPTIVAMGRGYLKGLVQQSNELSASEKEQASNIIEALATWVEKTRFTDPELVRKALENVTATARELDLKTLDQARAMSFDESAPKMKIAFNGLKKVLDVYGFSINDTLDSVKTTLVSSEGDNAVVQLDYNLLGTPLQATTEMVRIDGRWYSKDTIEKLKARKAEARMSAPATPAESTEPATGEG
ncbi:MAG TPA: hypothetical protein VFN25_08940 [Dokdonella sp.]|uniref:hypothetical protein n=1 Tax=Dokdonella sp. TaxID=2291710 RepID=UPI002D80560B|nr:hypothetical protein [Dokdonella sp.]HET9033018.1 hypothetical protein [Dokdonella sp.]